MYSYTSVKHYQWVTVLVILLLNENISKICGFVFNSKSLHKYAFKSSSSHVVQMSKITESALEKLRRDAENLRNMADKMEKLNNETSSSPYIDELTTDGFISTYATKIANNITKQKLNESLYQTTIFPSSSSKTINITKEYLLVNRSTSETNTEQFENLIKKYVNLTIANATSDDDSTSTAENGFSLSQLLIQSDPFNFLEAFEKLVARDVTTNIESSNLLALQVLEEYLKINWNQVLLTTLTSVDDSKEVPVGKGLFMFLARKLEVSIHNLIHSFIHPLVTLIYHIFIHILYLLFV